MRASLPILLCAVAAPALAAPGRHAVEGRTVETRLAELARVLGCTDKRAPDEPERQAACLVALHWQDAKADVLPPGDTPLVGATMEFPDVRAEAWRPNLVPAVGGMRVDKAGGHICEMDMYGDTPEQQAAVAAVKAPLFAALANLTSPLVVPPAVAAEARERVDHAPQRLKRRGNAWTTRFQGDVVLRHLANRWFLVETRKGNSGLWVSAFTADFTIGAR